MSERIKIDGFLNEVEVEIELKSGSKVYFLRDMNGHEHDAYLSSMSDHCVLNSDGSIKEMKKISGIQTALLVCCTYDADGKKVSLKELNELPAKVLSKMFELASKVNGMDDIAEEVAKKG